MEILMGSGPGEPEKSRAPHPPPFLRIPLACTFLSTLEEKRPRPVGQDKNVTADQEYRELAEHYDKSWKALYAGMDMAAFQPFLDEMEQVLALVMDSGLPQLQQQTLRQLGSFTPGDYSLAKRVAEDYLAWGVPPGENITPRLAIPAARMAVDQLLHPLNEDGGDVDALLNALPAKLQKLHETTLKTVEDNRAKEGTRALHPPEESFLDSLAEAFAAESPLEWLEEDGV
jgi:hypothetical protein